jgi:hypothetical protein
MKALSVDGFMLVTGLGVSPATIARQLAIAQHLTTGTPREVKERFTAKMSAGSYRGYKLQGIWNKEGGVPDNIEVRQLNPLNPHVAGILTVCVTTSVTISRASHSLIPPPSTRKLPPHSYPKSKPLLNTHTTILFAGS